ncbi:MAG: hypothetical protein IPP47_21495 [Bryobacterales bacterium]|nr:hypothetical protein [Bryobacterales bacterium]
MAARAVVSGFRYGLACATGETILAEAAVPRSDPWSAHAVRPALDGVGMGIDVAMGQAPHRAVGMRGVAWLCGSSSRRLVAVGPAQLDDRRRFPADLRLDAVGLDHRGACTGWRGRI